MDKIGIIGVGRLGLCFALNLEKAGFEIFAVDASAKQVDAINQREINSVEPYVAEYLCDAKHISASLETAHVCSNDIDLIFVCVPTPSLPEGGFDHSLIDEVCTSVLAEELPGHRVDLVINSTVMPGYCQELQERFAHTNYKISYNPEFIAQGTIIHDQQYPDQVLVGMADELAGQKICNAYEKMCRNTPRYSLMKPTEAEITKLAVNCFLTTKIAFANSIGDCAIQFEANPEVVLGAIGADRRIGGNFLRYGFGYGGPCLPRDNRALASAARNVGVRLPIGEATDESNRLHLDFQLKQFDQNDDPIELDTLSYKRNSDIIEESQQLALAVELAKMGRKVIVHERAIVIDQVRALYGELFTYKIRPDE